MIKHLILALFIGGGASGACAEAMYAMRFLPTAGGNPEEAVAINKSGEVLVNSSGRKRGRSLLLKDGVYVEVGSKDKVSNMATDLSKSEKVAGDYLVADRLTRAFRFFNGTFSDIEVPAEAVFTHAAAINDSGVVAGWYQKADGKKVGWTANGTKAKLFSPPFTSDAQTFDINAAGQVVGTYDVDGSTRAFMFQDGVIQNLGALGVEHGFSVATCINDQGVIAGYYGKLDGSEKHLFIYQAGVMKDGGSLGGISITPVRINNKGYIVGNATLPQNTVMHPFIYRDGQMYDLIDLIDPSTTEGWVLQSVGGINDKGQIAGRAHPVDDDRGYAVVLDPL